VNQAFRYRAATVTGSLVEGVVQAPDQRVALEELRRQTLVPVSIVAGDTSKARATWRGSRHDAVAASFRAMATLLGGGAPLDRVLEFAVQATDHPEVKACLVAVRHDVQSGHTFARALGAHADVFGTLAPAMVLAGEESGSLDEALERLADHLERARALRAQLRDALVYPVLLAGVAGLGVVVLLTFVVPRFVAMLADAGSTLPWTTRALVFASHAVSGYWWLWLGMAVVLVLAGRAWLADGENRSRWHAVRLSLPIVGPLEWLTWTSRFTRALGSLLACRSRCDSPATASATGP
jgi:type II secretory pathway component PulF